MFPAAAMEKAIMIMFHLACLSMPLHSRLEWIIKKSPTRGKRQLGRDRGPLWGSKNPQIKIPYVGIL